MSAKQPTSRRKRALRAIGGFLILVAAVAAFMSMQKRGESVASSDSAVEVASEGNVDGKEAGADSAAADSTNVATDSTATQRRPTPSTPTWVRS